MDNPQSPHRSDSQKLQALIMRPMRMLSQMSVLLLPRDKTVCERERGNLRSQQPIAMGTGTQRSWRARGHHTSGKSKEL